MAVAMEKRAGAAELDRDTLGHGVLIGNQGGGPQVIVPDGNSLSPPAPAFPSAPLL
jgi:hypothetical protein